MRPGAEVDVTAGQVINLEISCLTLYNRSMKNRDGRSLDHKALEDIRIQAVQRVEAGEAPSAVMRVLGFARTVIYDWLAKYRAGGMEALRALPIPGRPPKLSERQRVWVVPHGDAEQPAAIEVRVRTLGPGRWSGT